MDVISHFAARYERTGIVAREEEMSLDDYLAECKRSPLADAADAERMLKAIGEPGTIDARSDPRLSRIFANKVIKVYPAFAEFYGMDDAIEQVVNCFHHAAQELEETEQLRPARLPDPRSGYLFASISRFSNFRRGGA